MKDFFYNLDFNQYEEKHRKAIADYFYYSKSVDKYFITGKIQNAKNHFDNSLDDLRQFLGEHFSLPKNPNIKFYKLHPDLYDYIKDENDIPKTENYIRQCQIELSALQDAVEEKYDSFIKKAKNTLLV